MWNELNNLMFVLSHINVLNNFLSEQSDKVSNYDEIAHNILKEKPIETSNDRKKQYSQMIYDQTNFKDDGTIVEYQPGTKIELQGFCVIAVAQGNGILIPGNPKIGLALYKNKYYSASSINRLKEFQKSPAKIINNVLLAARNNPELTIFLDIFDQVRNGVQEFSGKPFATKVAHTNDNGMQTEMHPVPYAKDKDYVWNVWDLRRRAIQLANLRNCRTTSAQTHLTYSSFSIKNQTINPKDQPAQTKKDACININMDYKLN